MKNRILLLSMALISSVVLFGCRFTDTPTVISESDIQSNSDNAEIQFEQNVAVDGYDFADELESETTEQDNASENEIVEPMTDESVPTSDVVEKPDIEQPIIEEKEPEKTESEQSTEEKSESKTEVAEETKPTTEKSEVNESVPTSDVVEKLDIEQPIIEEKEPEKTKSEQSTEEKSELKTEVAEETKPTTEEPEKTESVTETEEKKAETATVSKLSVSYTVEVPSKYYYSLLSQSEKLFYDALQNAASLGQTEVKNLGQYGCSVDDFDKIIEYFRLDCVYLFNLSDSTGFMYNSDNIITDVTFSYIMDIDTYNSAIKEFEKIADDIKKQAFQFSTERERVMIVYDYVKNHLTYGLNSLRAYNMYYAYMDGIGVCEAYSKLFGYLLEKIGIESIQVNGYGNDGAHRWTMAKIDGEWYHFDVTWDDPIGQSDNFLYYNYFAVSDKVILLDHRADYPELLPKATATDANFFVANGLILEETDDGSFENMAKKSYSLTGHLIFSCIDSVYDYIKSDGRCLWTFVRAVSPSASGISFLNNDVSKVIEIVFN